MIGFSALLLVDQGIFGGIGIGIAFGIMVSLLVALSLLPAVLTLAGDRLFWPRKIYNTGTPASSAASGRRSPARSSATRRSSWCWRSSSASRRSTSRCRSARQRLRGQHGPGRREQAGLRRDQRRLRQRHSRQGHGPHDPAAGRPRLVGQHLPACPGPGRKRVRHAVRHPGRGQCLFHDPPRRGDDQLHRTSRPTR